MMKPRPRITAPPYEPSELCSMPASPTRTTATMMRNIPANGFYFYAYEGTRRAFTKKDETPTMAVNFFAGGMAGIAYWATIYPAELVKTRMQSDASLVSERKYKNIIDCITKTYQNEGPKAFFKGFSAAMLRSFPANAFCFLGYEAAMSSLRKNLPDL